jgi:hypothetical protein
MDQTDPSPILERAWRAYQITDGARAEQPVMHRSGEYVIAGLHYIALRSETATLAVYRLKNSGALRRLKSWPLALGCGAIPTYELAS